MIKDDKMHFFITKFLLRLKKYKGIRKSKPIKEAQLKEWALAIQTRSYNYKNNEKKIHKKSIDLIRGLQSKRKHLTNNDKRILKQTPIKMCCI